MRKQQLFGGFVLNLATATFGFSQPQPAAIVPVRGVITTVSEDMLIVNSSNTSIKISSGCDCQDRLRPDQQDSGN